MDQRISLVTLASGDLDAARRFYVDGLGWQPHFESPGGVIMFRAGTHLLLSLWDEAEFAQEVGPVTRGDGVAPITLAHNVGSRDEVDAVLAQARAAGAETQSAQDRVWGGYSGYFADPDGFRWEVAWNPDMPELVP